MNKFDNSAIGMRIRTLRKKKGLNQTEFAKLLDKSLRTVQKYETGEIEVSLSIIDQIADVLDSTSSYILGFETNIAPIRNLSDVLGFLFELEKISDIHFNIDVKKPPRNKEWECSITFKGKEQDADFNTDICLFLENWEEERDNIRSYSHCQSTYRKWQEQTLAYYASCALESVEPEELSDEERIIKRNAYLEKMYAPKKEDK